MPQKPSLKVSMVFVGLIEQYCCFAIIINIMIFDNKYHDIYYSFPAKNGKCIHWNGRKRCVVNFVKNKHQARKAHLEQNIIASHNVLLIIDFVVYITSALQKLCQSIINTYSISYALLIHDDWTVESLVQQKLWLTWDLHAWKEGGYTTSKW